MDTNHHVAAGVAPVEGDGVSYSGIVWFVVILVVTTLVCQGLMWVLLKTFQHQATVAAVSPVAAANERVATEGRVYPTVTSIGPNSAQPKLLVNEPANLEIFRAKEHDALTTYGWMDKNAGTVRIPIERAKDLLIERGLPVRGAADASAAPSAAKDVKK
jgi:hypothetical protein